jgi:thiamine biosynthesis lipoprotein
MPSLPQRTTTLTREQEHWVGRFSAMASPCELLTDVSDRDKAQQLLDIVANEAWRIESKFSRYVRGNVIHKINNSHGRAVSVDAETAQLIEFAITLYGLTDGGFDITSGILREVWSFKGKKRVPAKAAVARILKSVGWDKVVWDSPTLILKPGMQIDFGGIGKEYAVDRAGPLTKAMIDASCLINFGGDLIVTRPREDGKSWSVGIEQADSPVVKASRLIMLRQGALATSGDTKRYVLKSGKRYGHVLDARTGWPIEGAPRTVTVAADTCLEAGMLTTIAMLQGSEVIEFLEAQDVRYWCE